MSTLTIERFLLLALLATMAMSCSPIAKDGQPATSNAQVSLRAGQPIGQTFQARDSGMNGVEIYLAPQVQGNGILRLHLRNAPTSTSDIDTASLAIQQVTAPAFYRFAFSPRDDSLKHAYYLLLEAEGEGSVQVITASGDTFLDGALYQNGTPVDAQATFRLTYDPVRLALGLLQQVASWLGVAALAIFLFGIPGFALLKLFWCDSSKLSWGEKLGVAIGISLAIYPLLLLWTHFVSLQLGALSAWLPPLASIAFLSWHYRNLRLPSLIDSLREWRRSDAFLPDAVFLFLIVLVVFLRFWVIRSLEVPMWGDSYHHTMIAQLIVDNGGLFDSWQPYADLQTLTYHFGFHSAVAAFYWVTGTAMPQAVLWVGQVFNVFAVLALYPLALRVGKNRWAGVGAVLIGGLVAPMPMFYLNWGRYTQLAGQVILPGAVILAWTALEAKKRDWRLFALAWIMWSGLALTHYRIAIFGAFFIVVFFFLHLGRQQIGVLVSRMLIIALGAMVFFIPWFIHAFAGKILTIFAKQITTPPTAVADYLRDYNAIGNIVTHLPIVVWMLIPLCIVLGLLRRDMGVALVSLWWSLIFMAANPRWFQLPGEGILSNFAVLIVAYIPASVLLGSALVWLLDAPHVVGNGFRVATATILIIGFSLLGSRQRLSDLQIPEYALATTADLHAARWIRSNIPANARFLVNSFLTAGSTIVVGSDGGWWLPLTAARQTTLPPLNYLSEKGPQPDYVAWVNALTTEIQNKSITSPESMRVLRERGVTHIYIGQRQGHVNYSGPDVLRPEELLASPNFRAVYHQDRVWVFEVIG